MDPETVGRYQILQRLGQGAMGQVFLAFDPSIGRQVAVKVLRDADSEHLHTQFMREGQAAGRLNHPSIAAVYDAGEAYGVVYIVMEYVEGTSLGTLIHDRAPLPFVIKLGLIEQLCRGLAYAHAQNVIHRDVKPNNCLVTSAGVLKILDFGIARLADVSGLTEAGMLMGTANYMSPEQVEGKPIDARADIFAVGVVAYELLAYRMPFAGDSLPSTLRSILTTNRNRSTR